MNVATLFLFRHCEDAQLVPNLPGKKQPQTQDYKTKCQIASLRSK